MKALVLDWFYLWVIDLIPLDLSRWRHLLCSQRTCSRLNFFQTAAFLWSTLCQERACEYSTGKEKCSIWQDRAWTSSLMGEALWGHGEEKGLKRAISWGIFMSSARIQQKWKCSMNINIHVVKTYKSTGFLQILWSIPWKLHWRNGQLALRTKPRLYLVLLSGQFSRVSLNFPDSKHHWIHPTPHSPPPTVHTIHRQSMGHRFLATCPQTLRVQMQTFSKLLCQVSLFSTYATTHKDGLSHQSSILLTALSRSDQKDDNLILPFHVRSSVVHSELMDVLDQGESRKRS